MSKMIAGAILGAVVGKITEPVMIYGAYEFASFWIKFSYGEPENIQAANPEYPFDDPNFVNSLKPLFLLACLMQRIVEVAPIAAPAIGAAVGAGGAYVLQFFGAPKTRDTTTVPQEDDHGNTNKLL